MKALILFVSIAIICNLVMGHYGHGGYPYYPSYHHYDGDQHDDRPGYHSGEDGPWPEPWHPNFPDQITKVAVEGSSSIPLGYTESPETATKKEPVVKDVIKCMQSCSVSAECSPVCGTDGITYTNPARLLCAQLCGYDVKIKEFSACSPSSNSYFQCSPTTTSGHDSRYTSPNGPYVKACSDNVAFRPLCNSNKNYDSLASAIHSGVDAILRGLSKCTSKDVNETSKVGSTLSNTTVQECIKLCPVEQKYSPICGSDDATYNNTAHLLCARQCGLDVEVKGLSACPSVSPPASVSSITGTQSSLTSELPVTVLKISSPTPNENNEDEDVPIDKRFGDLITNQEETTKTN